MQVVCTKCGRQQYWYGGRGRKLKNSQCKFDDCDGSLKSIPKKKPDRIDKPYVLGLLIEEENLGDTIKSVFRSRGRVHIYLDGSPNVCFPRPVIKGQWDTPVTYMPTGLQVENPGELGKEGTMFTEVVCLGNIMGPIRIPRNPELDPNEIEPEYREECAHCKDGLKYCRSRKRWIPTDAHERLQNRGV